MGRGLRTTVLEESVSRFEECEKKLKFCKEKLERKLKKEVKPLNILNWKLQKKEKKNFRIMRK
jgi:hypothetical protein